MTAYATCDLRTLYHLTEDHYFSATCGLHRRYSAAINAYFVDVCSGLYDLLFIRVGSAPLGEAFAAPLGLIHGSVLAIRIVVHEEKVAELREALCAIGFQPAEQTTAMVLELSRFIPRMSEGTLQVCLTRDLNEWAGPVGSAYSMLPEVVVNYQARHQRALDAGEALYHFTLSAEGRVSCSLTLSLCEGEARLNDVGTLKGFRGRGYATCLIQAALLHASSLGAHRCFLEASAEAISLYLQLGFARLFEYQAFTRGALADR